MKRLMFAVLCVVAIALGVVGFCGTARAAVQVPCQVGIPADVSTLENGANPAFTLIYPVFNPNPNQVILDFAVWTVNNQSGDNNDATWMVEVGGPDIIAAGATRNFWATFAVSPPPPNDDQDSGVWQVSFQLEMSQNGPFGGAIPASVILTGPNGRTVVIVNWDGKAVGPVNQAVYNQLLNDVTNGGATCPADLLVTDGTAAQAQPYPTLSLITVNDVPEPTTLIIWSLLGGLGITLGWWRRKAA